MTWLEIMVFAAVAGAAGLWAWRRDHCTAEALRSPRGLATASAHGVALSLLVQRNVSWFSTGTANVVEWVVLTGAAASAAFALRRIPITAWPAADRWYASFLMALIPGALLATEPGASATVLVRSGVGLLSVAALHCTATRRENTKVVADWTRLVAVMAIVGNAVFAVSHESDLPYASALVIPRLHPNDVGFIGVILVALSLLPTAKNQHEPLLAPGWLPVGWSLVVFGHYRAGLAGIVIVIAAAWPRLTNRVRFALTVAFLTTIAFSEFVFKRLRVVTRSDDTGVQVAGFRRPLWDAAVDQFLRAPLLGRGINSVAEHQIRPTLADPIPWGQLRQVHNTWLDVAVSGGLVAFTVWCGFVACLVIAARRWWRRGVVLAGVVLACAGLDSLVDPVDRVGWVWLITMTIVVGGQHWPSTADRQGNAPHS